MLEEKEHNALIALPSNNSIAGVVSNDVMGTPSYSILVSELIHPSELRFPRCRIYALNATSVQTLPIGDVHPLLFKAVAKWFNKVASMANLQIDQCIRQCIKGKATRWSQIDGQNVGCLDCYVSGKVCVRYLGEDVMVLPLSPHVRSADVGPESLFYWWRWTAGIRSKEGWRD